MSIREGRWRCPRCNEENLGRHLECTSCGDTRDDGVEFYLPGDAPELTDEQLLQRAAGGADLLCEHCDASNPASAEVCDGCGAPLSDRQRPVTVQTVASAESSQPASPSKPASSSRRHRRKKPVSQHKKWGCITLVVLALAALLIGRFWQREVTLKVSSVSWQRSFDAERLTTVTRTGWEGDLPGGAREQSRKRAVREHRKVQVGTTTETEREEVRLQVGTERVQVGVRDLGNGFFEDVYEDRPLYENQIHTREVERPVYREDPIYAIEVTYLVDEWQVARRAEALGDDLDPRWPDLDPGERERSGTRKETYVVRFKGARGKIYKKQVLDTLFPRYPPGSRHLAKVDRFGTIRNIKKK